MKCWVWILFPKISLKKRVASIYNKISIMFPKRNNLEFSIHSIQALSNRYELFFYFYFYFFQACINRHVLNGWKTQMEHSCLSEKRKWSTNFKNSIWLVDWVCNPVNVACNLFFCWAFGLFSVFSTQKSENIHDHMHKNYKTICTHKVL